MTINIPDRRLNTMKARAIIATVIAVATIGATPVGSAASVDGGVKDGPSVDGGVKD